MRITVIICFHAKFHTVNSNDALIIAIKLIKTRRFRAGAMLFPTCCAMLTVHFFRRHIKNPNFHNPTKSGVSLVSTLAVWPLLSYNWCSEIKNITCNYGLYWHGVYTNIMKICKIVRSEVFTAVTIKNAVFWDVGPCRYFVNRRFGETYRLHLQSRKIRERGTSCSLQPPAHAASSFADFLLWKWRRYVSPKRRFTQAPHGATSEKTALFIGKIVHTLFQGINILI
jgi:hypothetical protein